MPNPITACHKPSINPPRAIQHTRSRHTTADAVPIGNRELADSPLEIGRIKNTPNDNRTRGHAERLKRYSVVKPAPPGGSSGFGPNTLKKTPDASKPNPVNASRWRLRKK